MGVYYNVYAACGIKLSREDMGLEKGDSHHDWLEENTPEGYDFVVGGSYLSDTPIHAVIAKPEHIVKLWGNEWDGTDDGGVRKLGDIVSVSSKQDVYDLVDLAQELGVPHTNVDFWLVSLWS